MANARPVTIDQFKGENFTNWKFRVEMLLAEYDVLDCVTNQSFVKSITKGDEKAVKKDTKAKNILVKCVADSHLSILKGKQTSYQMWRALIETREKGSV